MVEQRLFRHLDTARLQRLRKMATWFVNEKDFYPMAGMELDSCQRAVIAAQACLPVVDLGYEWLEGWYSVYVFPGAFRTRRNFHDEMGLAGEEIRDLAGEAHLHGGLVLSWEDVAAGLDNASDGVNLVIHEIAHKLDMRNGQADGYPPLHRRMSSDRWEAEMRAAFDNMRSRLERGESVSLDTYAASEPAEFFAVMSEYYFEQPDAIADVYPQVLELLTQFYQPESIA